jgi:hypothetical protein
VPRANKASFTRLPRGDQKNPEKISVVQLPDGKTYARGRFLFSAHPGLRDRSGERWFEVPEPLLTADAGEAHPEGPQGVFELDMGYKAAISSPKRSGAHRTTASANV